MSVLFGLLMFVPIVLPPLIVAAQIIAGTPEDKLFQQILSEKAPDAKLQLLSDFENRFPESKVLPDIYLMMVDVFREKGDRTKVIEYGEKALAADQDNVTAMMILSRNYALEGQNLDRAVMLAERAVDLIGRMKQQATPPQYTDTQWKDYLQNTDGAARSILEYVRSVKGR